MTLLTDASSLGKICRTNVIEWTRYRWWKW